MKGTDILDVAAYGAITYWATIRENVQIGSNGYMRLRDDEDGTTYTIRAADAMAAAHKVVDKYPNTRGAGYIRTAIKDNDPGMIDAEAADMIVQVACFGEIVYG